MRVVFAVDARVDVGAAGADEAIELGSHRADHALTDGGATVHGDVCTRRNQDRATAHRFHKYQQRLGVFVLTGHEHLWLAQDDANDRTTICCR